MRALILRLDAPLISFGAPSVDQNGVVQAFPPLSMLVGLFANALGWLHWEAERLERLQERLRFAARIDREGEPLVDYQTVALGTDWMRPEKAGWTTRGRLAGRGGASGDATHQRYRHYRADSLHTVAIALAAPDELPTLDELMRALREPARPLFLGRKCCLPAAFLSAGIAEAASLLQALAAAPRHPRGGAGELRACCFEEDDSAAFAGESRVFAVTDERDWANRIHVGRRIMREGRVNPPGEPHA
jgi:CRISPR system Cascade subunit CasD